MADDDSDDRSRLEIVITKGSQLAGALATGTVGTALAGPLGAVGGTAAGWAAGEVVAGAALEVMHRMSGRGAERAAATALLIAGDAVQREERGEKPRADGFFEERGALRPEENELLESVLLTAANTYEERKLPYLANLFNAVKFDASIKGADGLFASRAADQLTYRQLEGLSVIGKPDDNETRLALAKTPQEDGSMLPDPAFMWELDDLGVRDLVGAISPDDDVPRSPTAFIGTDKLSEIAFTRYRLTQAGERLYRLMKLEQIPSADQEQWLSELEGSPRL